MRINFKRCHYLLVALIFSLVLATTGCGFFDKAEKEKTDLKYTDIVNRLLDLEQLAVLPKEGEKSAEFSSYDRASDKGDAKGWAANGDSHGIMGYEEDGGKLLAEMEGPGYISRIWSATPKAGKIKIFVDDHPVPVIYLSLTSFFSGKHEPYVYDELSYVASEGSNTYLPITYNKSCKVVGYDDIGDYYQINYTTLPKGYSVESFSGTLSDEDKAALKNVNSFFKDKLGSDPKGERKGEKTSTESVTLKKGEEYKFSAKDSGAVTAIKVKINNLDKISEDWNALSELVLSAYWDGEQTPSLFASLGQFFGNNCGISPYSSLSMGVGDDGLMYSYWYMPYEKGAELVFKNEGESERNFDVSITTAPLTKDISRLSRFHAKWSRGEYREEENRWPDYRMLKTEGKGRVVGFSLHAYKTDAKVDPKSTPGNIWWGEGDEKFYIDNEEFPSWFGTGTEDYFGYAWCSFRTFTRAFHNQPFNEGGVNNAGSKLVNRFHITDNIPFQSSFEGFIEKYYDDDHIKYGTTAFWYLDAGTEDSYGETSLDERTDYYKVPFSSEPSNFNEGETLFVSEITGGVFIMQDMRTFQGIDKKWSGEGQLWWTEAKIGDKLSVVLPAENKGRYKLAIAITTASDYGMFNIYANGNKVGDEIDGFSDKVLRSPEIEVGEVSLNEGYTNTLTFELTGKNEKSKGLFFGLDYIKLIPLE